MTDEIEVAEANIFAWQNRGRMTLSNKGLPCFPFIEELPGVYELFLDNGWVYFGQGKNLRNRLADYCSGKTGLVQEQRLHEALKEAGGATVRIIVAGNLDSNSARCMLESQAVAAARSAGKKVLNATRAGDPYHIQLDIRFHEEQLKLLRAKLAKLQSREVQP